jgi:hypothetical protein
MFLMVWDFLVDRFQAALDWTRRKGPRLVRSVKFSVHRAVGNALFREITTFFIQADIVRGMPIIYANYLGYDTVAHYGGPNSWDALSTLPGIDRQIKKISRMIDKKSTKHFDLIILSDHGQTQCLPFEGLYGYSLHEFIAKMLERRLMKSTGEAAELGYFNALLREVRIVEAAYGTRGIRRGRKTLEQLERRMKEESVDQGREDDVVVCASGNLAHVYLTERSDRITTEFLLERYPVLLERLVSHEGIGFVITTNNEGEPLLMGKEGMRRLRSGTVEGVDPLIPFANGESLETLSKTLTVLSSYPSAGDIILNGRQLPNGSVVSFENQRGTHGGLGGDQTRPFIIYPRRFRTRGEDRVGSLDEIHAFLKTLNSQ